MTANTFDGIGRAARGAGHARAAGATESETGRAAASTTSPGFSPIVRRMADRRAPRTLSKARAFFRARCGTVAIESTLAISVLVVVCGGLMAICHAAYTDDRMGRAARAAARAIALTTDASPSQAALTAVACDAIRRELDLDAEFDCAAAWTVTVRMNLTPTALAAGTDAGERGDMILVEIGWQQAPWARAASLLDGSGAGTAVGLARRELAD